MPQGKESCLQCVNVHECMDFDRWDPMFFIAQVDGAGGWIVVIHLISLRVTLI